MATSCGGSKTAGGRNGHGLAPGNFFGAIVGFFCPGGRNTEMAIHLQTWPLCGPMIPKETHDQSSDQGTWAQMLLRGQGAPFLLCGQHRAGLGVLEAGLGP